QDTTVEFTEGINVIIGHNNAGKTNLLKALSLVVDYQGSKRLGADDFCKYIPLADLKAKPPKIEIEVTIKKGQQTTDDDLPTIGDWLTNLGADYEAILTYQFFLPEDKHGDYTHAMTSISETEEGLALKEVWKTIHHDFLRYYKHKIFGGKIEEQNVANGDSLQRFDFQFLDAIRDVERDMLTGRNTLLREVVSFFMDYDIKQDATKSKEQKEQEIKIKKNEFSVQTKTLQQVLDSRMAKGKEEILAYAKSTGASSFNDAVPDFEGEISETELYASLRLIIKQQTGITIPATHNGLGYNNLIFMSLLLAKMQADTDTHYLGGNAKVFTMLAIEEPEAHLHPAMQYKFLKFLEENKNDKKARQIFITTHSTHITSATKLDDIICLHSVLDAQNIPKATVGYVGKVFPNTQEGKNSKNYVQRFLDATKSDMLFANKVILVEGLAEQLLLPVLAEYEEKSLEDNHISVVSVGGRYFEHFLYLFDTNQSDKAIPKKVACLIDRAPERIHQTNSEKEHKCYPYEYKMDTTNYKYSNNATHNLSKYRHHKNIRFFSQDYTFGKTLEYDLAFANPNLEILITSQISHQAKINALMTSYQSSLSDLFAIFLAVQSPHRKPKHADRIKTSLEANNKKNWTDEDKKSALIASIYLNSVGKGENALELAETLAQNLTLRTTDPAQYKAFNIPTYIKEALEWICQTS
ncbi:MAG: ATP-dependent endonuclease, partial [Bacteroidetes bacterium]